MTKQYPGRRALDDVSFSVLPGEIFGFVGANGAGKTTAMRITMGVTSPTSGSVSFGGSPIDMKLRTSFGYMPEERGLYPKMPVHAQLTYLGRLHGLTRREANDAATYWEERLGITAYRNDAVEKLSLGNQQRVQLAAALAHDPALLVLDEPFSGLDPVAVETMADALRDKASAGVPVLFSSHQLDLVERLCDRVGILASGRLVACGTIRQLRDKAPKRTLIKGDEAALASVREACASETIDKADDGLVIPLDVASEEAQRLLDRARTAGVVTSFGPHVEPLSVLYRHAVTATSQPEEPHQPPARRRSLFGWKGGHR